MKEPIRILNLFTIMNRGGTETMVMNYYRKIDKSKVQFDFMVHRSEQGLYDKEIEELGGRIFRMIPIRPWSLNAYRKQLSEFFKNHPEYKIIHSQMSELGYYAFVEAKKVGIPVRISHAHSSPNGFNLKTIPRFYLKKRMLPYITHMFMCGEKAGEWLFGKKNKNSTIQVNNAIDAKKYIFNPTLREKVRREFNISNNQIVVGHVGNFTEPKNHKFIIDVFSEIQKQNKNAVLLLVGDDSGHLGLEIHQKIQQLGLQNVIFTGTRSDVDELMQAMDVFLFPSLFEGLSLASVEAQAAGLPVLISDRVPIECKKTDLVKVIPLATPVSVWADAVFEAAKVERRNTYDEIKKAGFDVEENAKWLQEFYLKVASEEK